MTTIETLFAEWCEIIRFADRWGFSDDVKDRDANQLQPEARPETPADMARLVVVLGNGCHARPTGRDQETQLILKAFGLLDLPEQRTPESEMPAAA